MMSKTTKAIAKAKIVMIHRKISKVSKMRCKSFFKDEVKIIRERLVFWFNNVERRVSSLVFSNNEE